MLSIKPERPVDALTVAVSRLIDQVAQKLEVPYFLAGAMARDIVLHMCMGLTKEDFSQKGSIYLRPEAEFDYLVSLPDSANRARAVQHAMETIEEDYADLKGVLPLGEYAELDNEVLGQLLRTLNPEELKQASGDVFGRIYEYFLTQFADLKAHDNGEFFTPVSLVQLSSFDM